MYACVYLYAYIRTYISTTINNKSLVKLHSDEFGGIKFGEFTQNISKCKARLGFELTKLGKIIMQIRQT